MEAHEDHTALPLRAHTMLGICEGIGEDFGFNPTYLRVPLAASVLWSLEYAVIGYLALGVIVLASRLLFPKSKAVAAGASDDAAPLAANEGEKTDLPLAA